MKENQHKNGSTAKKKINFRLEYTPGLESWFQLMLLYASDLSVKAGITVSTVKTMIYESKKKKMGICLVHMGTYRI